MPDPLQTNPDAQFETIKTSKFPFLHLFAGLVISCIGFILMVCIWAGIVNLIDPSAAYGYFSGLSPVLAAYLVPELVIIGVLTFLAFRNYRSDNRNYMRSYIAIAIINVVCFCLVCMVMSSVQC